MSANWGDNTPQPRPHGPGAVRWQAPANEPWSPPVRCPVAGNPDRCCVFSFTWGLCRVAEAELAARTQSKPRVRTRIDWFSVLMIVILFVIVAGFFLWLSLHPTVVL